MTDHSSRPRRRLLLIASTLSLALACTVEERAPSTVASEETVRALLQERVDRGQNAGIVVGLLEPDRAASVIAAGVADDALFEIGSITKVFTSVLLADMVERGEVALSDPVSRLLPPDEVKVPSRNGKEITLLDLATHHSGLPRLPSNLERTDPRNPYADYTVDQMYAFLSGHELRRDPGAKGEYSNLGMGLLGHALALRAGMSYEELLKERILDPLGMNDTAITLTPELRSRLATGHDLFGEPTSNWDIPTLAGAGAIRSTLPDMLLFAGANLSDGDEPIHRALRATHAPRRPFDDRAKIALNWIVIKPKDVTITWHNGGTGGYRTFLGLDLEGRRAVVVLSNTANSADDIGLHLLDPSIELAEPPVAVEVAVAYRDGGIDAALARARDLKAEGEARRFGEGQLNGLAYQLIAREAVDDAIALLKLNVEFFPDHHNPYDSLGECYTIKGERALAIEYYRKSLELNPENEDAVAKLAELEAGG